MTSAVQWLSCRGDPRIIAALGRRCKVCKAKPGDDCFNLVDGQPLKGRIVHFARTTP